MLLCAHAQPPDRERKKDKDKPEEKSKSKKTETKKKDQMDTFYHDLVYGPLKRAVLCAECARVVGPSVKKVVECKSKNFSRLKWEWGTYYVMMMSQLSSALIDCD